MNPEKLETICVLAVVAPTQAAAIERIFAHTRWRLCVAQSLNEARQVLQDKRVSVVLCDQRLPDGTWLDLLRETDRLTPRPQIVVLSASADARLWAEVLNCGGYDLLAKPLEGRELYALIPAAWRQWKREADQYRTVPNFEQELERC